ncbi:tetratricopeptide repeat protein [Polynucleobacter rarus]|uniref:tetratricopeptide repeat protein n=1 Tax=Polynucleobacter rarus TaxID=556055 RepID=UPI000D3E3000|nr:tetratricopeptide repeat protein [Polynucleobacter rarus]
MTTASCPQCSELATFSKKRSQFYCSECELVFNPPATQIEPQTIFLSYAHKSEREEDYDVSEELVWLIKDELEKDGHRVWIDQEGITAGAQWRDLITSAILGHTHFLSFLSKRSVRDPGVCLNEIAIALGSGRQIQTLLTESEEAVRQPLTISHLQWHHFADWKVIKDGQKTGPKGESWDAWFGKHMSFIRENLSNTQHQKVAGDLQRLKDILEPRTFEADIIKSIEGFYGRKWLFDACEQWLNTSTNRLFWLKGSPGIGKSSFVAKLVHQSNSAIVGFFKCEFQGSKSPEESASECIRTLAYQLAARLPDYRTKLLYQQLINKDKICKKTADDLFTYLITEPLNTSGKIPEATRLALAIDALDEAGRNDGTNALADLIHKHAEKLPPWLGIIVTSRPEPYLEQQLGKFESTPIEGGTEQNLQDLRDYLNKKLDPSMGESQRTTIIDQVIEKSGGTFLYIKLIEKDKTLDLAKPETLPKGIDDVFMRDFKRYFPNPKEYGQEAEPFLRLMAVALGPLPVDLAKDLLAWTSRDITTKVTQPLGSLLQEKNGGLVFFHKSISDWLQDQKRSGLYRVNDTGAIELGNFLWREFEKFENSKWQSQVLGWLPPLLLSTEYWDDRSSLQKFAQFLEKNIRFVEVFQVLQRQLSLSESADGLISKAYAISCKNYGVACTRLAKYSEAVSFYRQSLQALENVYGTSSPNLCEVLINLANCLKDKGDYAEVELLFKRSLEICRVKNLADNYEAGESLHGLAMLYWTQGNLTQALGTLNKTYDVFKGVFGEDDIKTIDVLNSIATLTWTSGKYLEAIPLYAKVLKSYERILPQEHPKIARTLNNWGILTSDQGEYYQAQDMYKRALLIFEKCYGDIHPCIAMVITNLANLIVKLNGCTEEAESLYKRALEIRTIVSGPDHMETAGAMNSLANLLFSRLFLDDAEMLFRNSLKIYEAIFGEMHADTALALNNLANLLKAKGAYAEAESLYTRSYMACKNSLGENHPRTLMAQYSLSTVVAKNLDLDLKNDLEYQRLIYEVAAVCGENHPNTIVMKNGLDFLLENRCFVRDSYI